MREISIFEMELVAGAADLGDVADGVTVGGAIVGALGVSAAVSAGGSGPAVLGMTGMGAAAGSGLGAAFVGGLAVGTWL